MGCWFSICCSLISDVAVFCRFWEVEDFDGGEISGSLVSTARVWIFGEDDSIFCCGFWAVFVWLGVWAVGCGPFSVGAVGSELMGEKECDGELEEEGDT